MDAIKKKMMSLASETSMAEERAKKFEDEAIEASKLADRTEEQVRVRQNHRKVCTIFILFQANITYKL